MYAAMDRGVEYVSRKSTRWVLAASQRIVRRQLERAAAAGTGAAVTKVAVNQGAKRMARTFLAKLPYMSGFGVQGLFGGYEIIRTGVDYNAGDITRRDATVYTSLGGLSILGAATGYLVACTKLGAVLGTSAGPVGTAIGVGAGFVAGVGGFAYGVVAGYQEKKLHEAELEARLLWASEENKAKIERKISSVRKGADDKISAAWGELGAK